MFHWCKTTFSEDFIIPFPDPQSKKNSMKPFVIVRIIKSPLRSSFSPLSNRTPFCCSGRNSMLISVTRLAPLSGRKASQDVWWNLGIATSANAFVLRRLLVFFKLFARTGFLVIDTIIVWYYFFTHLRFSLSPSLILLEMSNSIFLSASSSRWALNETPFW